MRTLVSIQLAKLVALTLALGLSLQVNAQEPNLSKLTAEQKENGVGQVQKKEPKKSEEKKKEEPRRPHVIDYRPTPHFHHSQVATPVATGGAAIGLGVASGNYYDENGRPWSDPGTNFPNATPPIAEGTNDPQYLGYAANDGFAKPMKFDSNNRRYSFGAGANAFIARDFGRLSVPINEDVYSRRLGWSGATGFEASIDFLPKYDDRFGINVGGLYVDGGDEATSGPVSYLYTLPEIGFSPHAMQSTRNSTLSSIETNLVLPGFKTCPWWFGIRYIRFDDSLTNQVLPTGVYHRIRTHSNTALIQLAAQPKIDFRWFQIESMFQVGTGVFWADATTDLANVVSATPLPSHVETERITGALFFNSKVGIAIPLGNVGVIRSGLSLMAQHDLAQAAAQMSEVDLVDRSYRLRTEAMFIGALYAGAEFRR